MIIWLASYPKSGNTWLRSILVQLLFNEKGIASNSNVLKNVSKISSYPQKKYFERLSNFSIKDFNNKEVIMKNWIDSQNSINQKPGIKIFKTHNYACKLYDTNGNGFSFTNLENSIGVIYIVRDPRNIITSIKNHFSMDSYEEAFNMMDNKDTWLVGDREGRIPEAMSSWDNHYLSWSRFPKNFHLIKYENLLSETEFEIRKLKNYLNSFYEINENEINIEEIVKSTNFKSLKKNEEEYGFEESVSDKNTGNKIPFFNLGPKNDWRNLLTEKITKKIEERFGQIMQKLGYLN